MKILVLSFYFQPDLSAGAFRATALVDALRQLAPANLQIDVITTRPNRYASFKAAGMNAPANEQHPQCSITRIDIPAHQSGLLDQSRSFLTFARGAARRAASAKYDIVFATSSRLMTAVLGAWIARRQRATLYLDIRDIFADTMREVLPRAAAAVVAPMLGLMERWAIGSADRVNLVSAGFTEYFSQRYSGKEFTFHTNGIDDEFLNAVSRGSWVPRAREHEPASVLYAGNIGQGQGLDMILAPLAKRMGSRVHFKIIGDGGRRSALESALLNLGVTNVELLPPMRREELLEAYRASDVLFLHLNDYEAFKKVLPSKLFEYAALGKPVWAGVAGYAADFIRSEISNAVVFRPGNVEEAVSSFDSLVLRDAARTAFVAKYARGDISKKMAAEILALANGVA